MRIRTVMGFERTIEGAVPGAGPIIAALPGETSVSTKTSYTESIRPTLVLFTPILIAVTGFAGFILYSMLPIPPSEDLYDLHQRLEAARSAAVSAEQARALDRVATTLEAARRAIKHERDKGWTLRSYDRAHALLWRAEALLDGVETSAPPDRPAEAVPAG